MGIKLENLERYVHYVYLITNNINNKKYIGKRSCVPPIETDNYMGSGTLLKRAFKKYGISNFSKEILVICNSEEDCFKKEQEYIKFFNALYDENFYNLTKGGEGIFGVPHTKETIEKMRKSSPNSKKCYCYNTKETFNSLSEACRKYNITLRTLYKCIKGIKPSGGKCPETGERLKWGLVLENGEITSACFRERKKSSENQKKAVRERLSKKVLLIETGEVFNSITEAASLKNLDQSSIICNCKGKYKYTIDKKTKEIYHWKYYEEKEGKEESEEGK